jgi:3D (Asp-Asp-Asp) domain-containing protein
MTIIALAAALWWSTTSTAYCLNGTMADGSWTRAGSAAHNGVALGTRIYVKPAVLGRRRWIVRDRIGWGTELDFWMPTCGQAVAYGRRVVDMRVGWPVLTMTPRRHTWRRRALGDLRRLP